MEATAETDRYLEAVERDHRGEGLPDDESLLAADPWKWLNTLRGLISDMHAQYANKKADFTATKRRRMLSSEYRALCAEYDDWKARARTRIHALESKASAVKKLAHESHQAQRVGVADSDRIAECVTSGDARDLLCSWAQQHLDRVRSVSIRLQELAREGK